MEAARVAAVYNHAILRARDPVPGDGLFIRRTRGGRPVLLIAEDDWVIAYAVHGTLPYAEDGIQFIIQQGHILRRP